MIHHEESNNIKNLRSTIKSIQLIERLYDSYNEQIIMYKTDPYLREHRIQLNQLINNLDKNERGEAALIFISKRMPSKASLMIKMGISQDAARKALKQCTNVNLKEPSLIDALLHEIPSVPANPESPALRFLARRVPRVAAAIATTRRGLKQDNPSFRYDLKNADYAGAAVACGSFLVMSSIAGTRPGNIFLAVSCGIISQLVSTIKTVHREGKIADVLAAQKKETVRSPMMD